MAFLEEINTLRSCGLLFAHEGNVLLADEVVPSLRQTFGFEMSSASRRRLFDKISGTELGEALGKCHLKTSGSRDEKLDRLLDSYVQPTEVLRCLQLQTLRDIARESNASVSGSKDELVERLVNHYLYGLDVSQPEEVAPALPKETRALGASRFKAMFGALKGDDLTDILASIESTRITGAKETKVDLLFDSRFAEVSLLERLTNKALEETLAKNRLRTAGSKRERVERLIEHFQIVPESMLGIDGRTNVEDATADVGRLEGSS